MGECGGGVLGRVEWSLWVGRGSGRFEWLWEFWLVEVGVWVWGWLLCVFVYGFLKLEFERINKIGESVGRFGWKLWFL